MSRRYIPMQSASRTTVAVEPPSWPSPGTCCLWRGGDCDQGALEGRYVCREHAARLEALGERYRTGQLRPTAQDIKTKLAVRRRGTDG